MSDQSPVAELTAFGRELAPLSREQLYYLSQDLSPLLVSHRKQGGANLSYMEAWQIKATLIRVFGFGGFSADVIEAKVLRMQQDVPAVEWVGTSGNRTKRIKKDPETGQVIFNWSVTAQAVVRLTIHQTGATFTEAAAASQTGPDVGEVTDFAIKTAESDALKRAAIYLGTQFGLSLYNNGGTSDVVGAVWAPDQIGQVQAYVAEAQAQAAQQQQQAQQGLPPAAAQHAVANQPQQDDPHAARMAAALKVDERDGAGA